MEATFEGHETFYGWKYVFKTLKSLRRLGASFMFVRPNRLESVHPSIRAHNENIHTNPISCSPHILGSQTGAERG